MKYGTPEAAISHLKSSSIKMLYKEAIEYANNYVEETKNLYKSIEAKRVLVPNAIYNETFTTAIPNFFSSYDVIFSAQDTSSDIDYPLVFDDMSLKGIIYIRRYLESFELENDFCRKFNSLSITAMLQSYGKHNRIDYEQTPINLFELVFNNKDFRFVFRRIMNCSTHLGPHPMYYCVQIYVCDVYHTHILVPFHHKACNFHLQSSVHFR